MKQGCQKEAGLFGGTDSYYATSPAPTQNGTFFTSLTYDKIHVEDILDLTLVKNILALSSL